MLFPDCLKGQAQEIDGYILINDMPEGFEPKVGINKAHEYDLIVGLFEKSNAQANLRR